jgi:hypothetical protein
MVWVVELGRNTYVHIYVCAQKKKMEGFVPNNIPTYPKGFLKKIESFMSDTRNTGRSDHTYSLVHDFH